MLENDIDEKVLVLGVYLQRKKLHLQDLKK
jgi:hypothetical protein